MLKMLYAIAQGTADAPRVATGGSDDKALMSDKVMLSNFELFEKGWMQWYNRLTVVER